MSKRSVILIHGAWLTPAGWDWFKQRYEARGYRVIAPPWPLEDMPIEHLRSFPHPELKRVGIREIVDHYHAIIQEMRASPIIVGHSTGGLVAQLLLDRGLDVAGIAMDPVPFRGIIPRPRLLLSALPVFREWRFWNRVLSMDFKTFASIFAQTLPESEKRPTFDRYIAPTPGLIYLQGALGIGNGIHAGNPRRAPLLIVEGGEDRTIDSDTARAAFETQRKAPSLTKYKVFSGRSHFSFTSRAGKRWRTT